jgi:hypothetical protein
VTRAPSRLLLDVNGEGWLDLVLDFRTQDTNLRDLYERLLAEEIDADREEGPATSFSAVEEVGGPYPTYLRCR